MNEELQNVHKKIREIRIAKGISILKLSVESGISRSHLFYIETMKTSPSLETLSRIAAVLDVKLIDFFS